MIYKLMNRARRSVAYLIFGFAMYLGGSVIPVEAQEDALNILLQAARQGAKIGDDVRLDRFQGALRAGTRSTDDLSMGLARGLDDAALMRLRMGNAALARRIEAAPLNLRKSALELYSGGHLLSQSVDDIVTRARIVEQFGPEGLVYVARQQDAALDLIRIDGAVRAQITSAADAQRFVATLPTSSPKLQAFWKDAVVPNWRPLVAVGAIGAFFTAPDLFIDSAGFVTERASAAFVQAGVEIPLAFVRGVGEGAAQGVVKQFSNGGWAYFLMGLALVLPILGALFLLRRRMRFARLVGLFKRIRQSL